MRLPHPPQPDIDALTDWSARIALQLAPIYVESKVLDPASVTANSTLVQSFTFAGIKTSDVLMLGKPSRTAGLNIVQVWCETDDILSVAFENTTGVAIDAGSETYRLVGIRV